MTREQHFAVLKDQVVRHQTDLLIRRAWKWKRSKYSKLTPEQRAARDISARRWVQWKRRRWDALYEVVARVMTDEEMAALGIVRRGHRKQKRTRAGRHR